MRAWRSASIRSRSTVSVPIDLARRGRHGPTFTSEMQLRNVRFGWKVDIPSKYFVHTSRRVKVAALAIVSLPV